MIYRYHIFFDGADVAERSWQRLLAARNYVDSAFRCGRAQTAKIVAEYNGGRMELISDSAASPIAGPAPLGPRQRLSPLAAPFVDRLQRSLSPTAA